MMRFVFLLVTVVNAFNLTLIDSVDVSASSYEKIKPWNRLSYVNDLDESHILKEFYGKHEYQIIEGDRVYSIPYDYLLDSSQVADYCNCEDFRVEYHFNRRWFDRDNSWEALVTIEGDSKSDNLMVSLSLILDDNGEVLDSVDGIFYLLGYNNKRYLVNTFQEVNQIYEIKYGNTSLAQTLNKTDRLLNYTLFGNKLRLIGLKEMEQGTVKILDHRGRLLFSQNIHPQFSEIVLDLNSNISPGIYILSIKQTSKRADFLIRNQL